MRDVRHAITEMPKLCIFELALLKWLLFFKQQWGNSIQEDFFFFFWCVPPFPQLKKLGTGLTGLTNKSQILFKSCIL